MSHEQNPTPIPEDAVRAFRQQRINSARRKIPFHFTLEAWFRWWCENGWERRGRGADLLVMARHNDEGAYEANNVSAVTGRENGLDVDPERIRAGIRRARAAGKLAPCIWQGKSGAAHPRSKPVIGPDGRRYDSATIAAEAHGVHPSTVARRAQLRINGWRYEAA
jgi:hypothetical protein